MEWKATGIDNHNTAGMVSKIGVQDLCLVYDIGRCSDYHKTKSKNNLPEKRTETLDYRTWDTDAAAETENASATDESACYL